MIPHRKNPHQKNPYPNQLIAGDKTFDYYTRTQHRYGLLRADVQSGKTGIYQYLIRKMLERGIIDRAYIICGSHELELINQCKVDISEWHPERKNGEVKVLFRQHFNEKMNTHRALIVVDETHLVCDKDQTLSNFLQKHNLTMMGTTPEMIKNSTYILSVDATPFAELSAINYEQSYLKAIVTLKNADGYFGPMDYFNQGLIHETFSFNDERFDQLIAQLPQKYILVRITGKNRQECYHLISAAQRTGCDIVRFTSKEEKGNQQFVISQEDADKFSSLYPRSPPVLCLESAPSRTTIVIVDGRLRCGKRLIKHYIGAIWEASKGANTDTIIQGLLGRVCGYDVPVVKPLIFLPSKCLTRHQNTVLNVCDLVRAFTPYTIPRYASHIIPGSLQRKAENQNGQQLFPCVPIKFQLSPEDIQQLEELLLNDYHGISALCMRTFSADMLDETFTEEQRQEIVEKLARYIGPKRARIRKFHADSHPRYFNSMLEAVATKTTINEHIVKYPFLTFCVTYPGYHNESSVPGQVFAVIYTKSIGFYNVINMDTRIPKQDGKTHFTLPLEMRNDPAGAVVAFTPAIIDNPAEFKSQFDELIQKSKNSRLHFSREIVSLNDGPICFQPRMYGIRMERFNAIISYLERKHSVQIICERAGLANIGPNDSLYHIVTRISW
jgi:hypothetical protein